jgi:hypothetical protein
MSMSFLFPFSLSLFILIVNLVLNVRWATVDPNPLAQKREAQRLDEQAAEAIRRALPAEFVAEIEGKDPEARKRKKIEGSFGLEGYEPSDGVWYARTKAIEDATDKEHLDQRTEALASIEHTTSSTLPQQQQQHDTGGILSSSTLAALQGFQGNGTRKAIAATSGGPLVAYGSDDDSD